MHTLLECDVPFQLLLHLANDIATLFESESLLMACVARLLWAVHAVAKLVVVLAVNLFSIEFERLRFRCGHAAHN